MEIITLMQKNNIEDINTYLTYYKNTIDVVDLFFRDKYHYYYYPTSDLYIEYNEVSYKIINENEMIHKILCFISKHRLSHDIFTTSIKSRIKNIIKKKIKSSPITNSIPESMTLQNILSFFTPNLFNNKSYSKYFLTCIGDVILKKSYNLYFIPTSVKSFMRQLSKCISVYFHTINLFKYFKFKYKEHTPDICRIFKMNDINLKYVICNESLFINIICVSIHYSTRYKSGDDYLLSIYDPFKTEVLWIKENSPKQIIDIFIRDYIISESSGTTVCEKDMLYIWNLFVSSSDRINPLSKKQFIDELSHRITFVDGLFINVSSEYLPHVKNFKQFWETNIEYDPVDNFEIGELWSLYPKKIKFEEFVHLIYYYYPHLTIENGKNILNIKCSLWNKQKDIERFIVKHRNVNELYLEYCKSSKKHKVNKQYFINCYNNI
jgi:hypothetical protein